MQLMTIILDNADIEHFHHCGMFHQTPGLCSFPPITFRTACLPAIFVPSTKFRTNIYQEYKHRHNTYSTVGLNKYILNEKHLPDITLVLYQIAFASYQAQIPLLKT